MNDALVDNIKRFLVGLADVFDKFLKFFEKYFKKDDGSTSAQA